MLDFRERKPSTIAAAVSARGHARYYLVSLPVEAPILSAHDADRLCKALQAGEPDKFERALEHVLFGLFQLRRDLSCLSSGHGCERAR